MSAKRIDISLINFKAIEIKEDAKGFFFMIGDYRATIPPHFGAKNFNGQEVLSFFVDKLGDIGVLIIGAFLLDLIQKRKVKNVKIDNKVVNTEEEITEALKEE
jgi:hypothetical protein